MFSFLTKGKPFGFDYILYVCKSYKMDMSTAKKRKKKNTPEDANGDLMFINAEDELLSQVVKLSLLQGLF